MDSKAIIDALIESRINGGIPFEKSFLEAVSLVETLDINELELELELGERGLLIMALAKAIVRPLGHVALDDSDLTDAINALDKCDNEELAELWRNIKTLNGVNRSSSNDYVLRRG